jgi:hypothetical protein
MARAWAETEKEVIETRDDVRTRRGSVLGKFHGDAGSVEFTND